MLTRLEVDGFKNLLDVTVDFAPYTCVVGPNGVGKSNLFDAIHFLSLLADRPIMRAAAEVRGAAGRRADPRGLFRSEGGTRGKTMRFAAEIIVPRCATDDFGRAAEATTTFLRSESGWVAALTVVALGDAPPHAARVPRRVRTL